MRSRNRANMKSQTRGDALDAEMHWEMDSSPEPEPNQSQPKSFLLHPELDPWGELHYSYESFSMYPIPKMFSGSSDNGNQPQTSGSDLIDRLNAMTMDTSGNKSKNSPLTAKQQICVYMDGMADYFKMPQQEYETGQLQAKWISNYLPVWSDSQILTFRGACAVCVVFSFQAMMKHWPTFRALGRLARVPKAQIFCGYRLTKVRHKILRTIAPEDKIGQDVDKLLWPFGEVDIGAMGLIHLCELASTRLQLDPAVQETVMELSSKISSYPQFGNHKLPTIVASSVHITSRLMKLPIDSMDASAALDVGLLTLAKLCKQLYSLRDELVEQRWLDAGAKMARFPAN